MNVAKKFSNYQAFQFHFGELVIEKVGKDDYIAHRPDEDAWENWLQRGSKEYINGWLYGAVMRECGQIHRESENDKNEERSK